MGKGEQHYIWPSQCKYANMPFSNVYLRGSAADKMFSIPNISEFGPMGGRGVGILKKGGTYNCNQGSHKKKLRNFGQFFIMVGMVQNKETIGSPTNPPTNI